MLKIYIIGVLLTLLLSLIMQQFYYGAGSVTSMFFSDIVCDVIFSLLSWVGIILIIITLLGEVFSNYSAYGINKNLEDELNDND